MHGAGKYGTIPSGKNAHQGQSITCQFSGASAPGILPKGSIKAHARRPVLGNETICEQGDPSAWNRTAPSTGRESAQCVESRPLLSPRSRIARPQCEDSLQFLTDIIMCNVDRPFERSFQNGFIAPIAFRMTVSRLTFTFLDLRPFKSPVEIPLTKRPILSPTDKFQPSENYHPRLLHSLRLDS